MKNELEDLNKTFRDKMHALRNLSGHICQVYSMQESIQSLGGLPVLFPLLEQACFKVKKLGVAVDESCTSLSAESNTLDGSSVDDEDVDVVDGKQPLLSDLPVLYSPKMIDSSYSGGGGGGGDTEQWRNQVDDELKAVEVLSVDHLDSADRTTPTNASPKNLDLRRTKQAGSFVVLATPPLPRSVYKYREKIKNGIKTHFVCLLLPFLKESSTFDDVLLFVIFIFDAETIHLIGSCLIQLYLGHARTLTNTG